MEESAFAVFYQSTYRPLWAYVSRSIGDAEAANDIAQEAYVRMLQSARQGDEFPQAKAYLYRIATNLMHDRWRRNRHDALAQSVDLSDAREPATDDKLELNRLVNLALDRLPPQQRALLWLAHVEGYGHREIAPMMGVGERSVRVMLFRARRQILEHLRALGIASTELP